MANIEKFPLEARGETVSREALVQAALHEITQNYREASLSNVARSYGVSLAYVSECVRAQTGKTYKELLQKHRMETAARLLRRSDWNIQGRPPPPVTPASARKLFCMGYEWRGTKIAFFVIFTSSLQ